MAEYTALAPLFTDIANAIRSKTGETGAITANSFPDAISSLQTSSIFKKFLYPNASLRTFLVETGSIVGEAYTAVHHFPESLLPNKFVFSLGLATLDEVLYWSSVITLDSLRTQHFFSINENYSISFQANNTREYEGYGLWFGDIGFVVERKKISGEFEVLLPQMFAISFFPSN